MDANKTLRSVKNSVERRGDGEEADGQVLRGSAPDGCPTAAEAPRGRERDNLV